MFYMGFFQTDNYLDASQASFPILYSLSNSFLILDHVIWTLILWDALHNYVYSLQSKWWITATLIVVLHLLNSFIVSDFEFKFHFQNFNFSRSTPKRAKLTRWSVSSSFLPFPLSSAMSWLESRRLFETFPILWASVLHQLERHNLLKSDDLEHTHVQHNHSFIDK